MVTYRVAVGHTHGVKPGNLVGAIANEANLDSKHIGRIEINEDHSLVDLPEGMPEETLRLLRKARVAGRQLAMMALADSDAGHAPPVRAKPKFDKPRPHKAKPYKKRT